ncbi:uncharacterized protein LOC119078022 [Bradysia coprophila]|uniref:uncharacterized protein LOC119078022 n=1 Tax=Bradysia coprophila TaxID=38358 RepID=UPI00187DC81D|nr:uncharacterized protein LOC119078022 [Bradysia coprophila]XP_037041324.1 uncharacterized protein LOC119078022 [Bradysia coprophila]
MSTQSLGLALLSLMLIASQAFALKCWSCHSDWPDSEFCQEKLDMSLLTSQQRHMIVKECTPPKESVIVYGIFYAEKMVSRCRIQTVSVNGEKVHSRGCVVEAENASRNDCVGRNVLPGMKVLACETCQEDVCNESFSPPSVSAGIKTTLSMQLVSFLFVIVCLLF